MSAVSTDEQAQAYLERAKTLLDFGRHKEAIPLIAQSMSLNPGAMDTYCYFALALRMGGQLKEALAVIDDAIKVAPNHEWPFRLRSITCQELGDNKSAVRYAREAFRLGMDVWQTAFTLGNILVITKQFEEAEAIAQVLKRIAPDNAKTFSLLGRIAQDREQLIEAEMYFREALRLDPQDVFVHNYLGTVLMQQGRVTDGVKFFDSALNLDPTGKDAQANLYAGALALRRRSLLSTGKSLLLRVSPKVYGYYVHREERSFGAFFFVFLWRFFLPLAAFTALLMQCARLADIEIDTTHVVIADLSIGLVILVLARAGLAWPRYFSPSTAEVHIASVLTTWLFSPYPLLIYGGVGLVAGGEAWPFQLLSLIAGTVFFIRVMFGRVRGQYYRLMSRAHPWRLRMRAKRERFVNNSMAARYLIYAWKIITQPMLYFVIGLIGLNDGAIEDGPVWITLMCASVGLTLLQLSRYLTARKKRALSRAQAS